MKFKMQSKLLMAINISSAVLLTYISDSIFNKGYDATSSYVALGLISFVFAGGLYAQYYTHNAIKTDVPEVPDGREAPPQYLQDYLEAKVITK